MLKVIDSNKIYMAPVRPRTDEGRLVDIQKYIDEFDDERMRLILQEAWDRAVTTQVNCIEPTK